MVKERLEFLHRTAPAAGCHCNGVCWLGRSSARRCIIANSRERLAGRLEPLFHHAYMSQENAVAHVAFSIHTKHMRITFHAQQRQKLAALVEPFQSGLNAWSNPAADYLSVGRDGSKGSGSAESHLQDRTAAFAVKLPSGHKVGHAVCTHGVVHPSEKRLHGGFDVKERT